GSGGFVEHGDHYRGGTASGTVTIPVGETPTLQPRRRRLVGIVADDARGVGPELLACRLPCPPHAPSDDSPGPLRRQHPLDAPEPASASPAATTAARARAAVRSADESCRATQGNLE